MKTTASFLVLGLSLAPLGCTDPLDPPADTEDASSTAEDGTGSGGSEADGGKTDGADSSDGSSDGADDDSSDDQGSSDTSGGADLGPVEFFQGTSETLTPDGRSMGVDLVLARRQMVPADSEILETLYLIAPDRTWQRFELTQSVDLEAQTFTAEFGTDFGTLMVEGEFLAGEDWAWDQWRSRSTYTDGVSAGWTVLSEDARDPDGSHAADKGVYDDQDQLFFVIEERLEVIDEQTYEAEVAALE